MTDREQAERDRLRAIIDPIYMKDHLVLLNMVRAMGASGALSGDAYPMMITIKAANGKDYSIGVPNIGASTVWKP